MDVVRRRAEESGQRTALVAVRYEADLTGVASTLSYAAIDQWARAIAAELQTRCRSGDRAAVLCPQGPEYVVAFLGCLYAGVIAVPLYAPDPAQPETILPDILADAETSVLLTTASVEPAARQLTDEESAGLLVVDRINVSASDRWVHPGTSSPDELYLQYTSGSTSNPAGVVVTAASLTASIRQCVEVFELTSDTVCGSWLPLHHDMGLALAVTVPLAIGARTALMSPLAFVQRPARWLQLLSRYRATISATPNFALDLCVERVSRDELETVDLSSLSVLINGGELVRERSLRRFSERFADVGFDSTAHCPSYGLAEATVIVAGTPCKKDPRILALDRTKLASGRVLPLPDSDERDAQCLVSCGGPVNVEVLIVDPETRRRMPAERVGEVWVRGPSVAAGYFRNLEQSRHAFGGRTNDHAGESASGSWLRTGDLGFTHDGWLYPIGRLKDLVVIGGRNHHPVDIETTVRKVAESLRPGHVVAFSVDDGEAERLVLILEAPAGVVRAGVIRDLLRGLRAAISSHHGIELYDLLLVGKGIVPRTTSGKVQRGLCRERYLAGGIRSGRLEVSG